MEIEKLAEYLNSEEWQVWRSAMTILEDSDDTRAIQLLAQSLTSHVDKTINKWDLFLIENRASIFY